ncbi:MAG TPA: malto-oligosyltrehalose synthase [Xanthobacteraceae bacterium]|jgi:(1->4)-alpha-D-glucan 1-alpha-D-glucosylmutase
MVPAIPIATYRLQLTADFGFSRAAECVGYLKSLGVSHLYVSPFLKARRGSTHGYDVVDHNAINPELGGEVGFQQLCAALETADLGLILDFVPNHMGIHYANNAWWLDVLEWGQKSPYANCFDIDWALLPYRPAGGVLVPILGTSYGEALEGGEIELRYDAEEGSFSAWYYEHRLPITPPRYAEILEKVVTEASARDRPAGWKLIALAARYRGPHNPPREKAPAFKAALASIEGAQEIIERGLNAYRPKVGGREAALALHGLLERQHYRVAHWRLSASNINYRRFFDINSLAGLRVEDTRVFEAIHRLVARLIAEGRLRGLRLDHIDGLRDPQQYAARLQRLIGNARPRQRNPFYVVIEKILAEGEHLPRFPGVAGTTGYEWLNVLSRLLLDERGLARLDETWRRISGDRRSFGEVLIAAKRRVLATILLSEFTVLARLLDRIAAGHYTTRDYTAERLRRALELFILHFPVYRTYMTGSGPSREDRALIEAAIGKARAQWVGADASIFDLLRDTVTLDLIKPPHIGHSISRVRRFAFKLQQFTGPVMAKALEDTAFYRYHRLLALNEVGGNPSTGALSTGDFHARMEQRIKTLPHGLTATATHDTKRGEDARARILALPELAEEWNEAVEYWRELNSALIEAMQPRERPSPAHQYMLYQALLGAWPLEGPDDEFLQRMQAYAIKAAREAKEQTSWLDPNLRYEEGLMSFIEQLLDRDRSAHFLAAFEAFARRAALLGALNSLSQLTLKLTIPGVPDLYQGTEYWDLSLVDPDNRRPVDFAARTAALAAIGEAPDWRSLVEAWPDGRIKLALTRALLSLRQRFAELFTHSGYHAVEVIGPQREEVVAFARSSGRDAIIVAVGRLFARATEGGRRWPSGAAWNAALDLEGFAPVRSVLGAGAIFDGRQVAVRDLFDPIPIAVIEARSEVIYQRRKPGRRGAVAAQGSLPAGAS